MIRWLSLAILGVALVHAPAHAAPDQADDLGEKLPPGLVAAYRDTTRSPVTEIFRVEPTISFFLKPDESPHPRIDSRAWTANWDGQIQVFRAGRYRFSAQLIGRFRLTVAGITVLAAEAETSRSDPVVGPEVELPAGSLPVHAEFSKEDGPASLRVFWESSFFSREPLPWTSLRHAAADESAQLIRSMRQDRGRFLVEELSCVACHLPDDDGVSRSLSRRRGPDLSRVGERIYAGWLDRWLANPQACRPQAAMPQMFADDERGRTERYAVARFLSSLGGPPRQPRQEPNRDELQNVRRRGERLFGRVGCSICHTASDGKSALADLKHLGSKSPPDRLALFLQNPLAVDPSGRMPQMDLNGSEARDLAYFLCESVDDTCPRDLPKIADASPQVMEGIVREFARSSDESARLATLSDEEKLRIVGERIVVARGCTNCHRIAQAGDELPARPAATGLARLRSADRLSRGCLRARESSDAMRVPRFALSAQDRECIQAFLTEASTGTGSAAPTFAAQVTLYRFHCVGCHSRGGQAGLTPDQIEGLRRYETAQDAEAIQPPPLTEVGAKLRTAWLDAVLTRGRRARPWMGLRMPQFGAANVAGLAEQLAAADGVEPSDAIRQFPYDAAHVEAGRFLVGKKGFGCIACHDIAGQPNTGTRGPDLASMNERVRFDWYTRWLDDPQRMQPGTRMPTIFQNRATAIKTVLLGDARAQSEAIWEYLSLGANLPLPEGLEKPRGLVLEPKDKPLVVRSFMPDAGSRAVAVGFPAGISFAFDTSQCRLAYGWTGQFLDAAPIWQDRGGFPAGVQGPRFWRTPPGCPWELTDSPGSPPDWNSRLNDPARGARWPEGRLFDGPFRLRFRDYKIDDDGIPAFHYDMGSAAEGRDPARVEIRERFQPVQKLAGVGVLRTFELTPHRASTLWLLLAETKTIPELWDDRGERMQFEPRVALAEQPTHGHTVLLTDPAGIQILAPRSMPSDARWIISQSDGQWRVAIRVPLPDSAEMTRIVLDVWCPYRNEPTMIRTLLDESKTP